METNQKNESINQKKNNNCYHRRQKWDTERLEEKKRKPKKKIKSIWS